MSFFKYSYNYYLCIALLFSFYFNEAMSQEELLVKRKKVYEFTSKPVLKKEGDKISISFTSKDYCDATVAIENSSGRIVCHLASGVLGKNAPWPFKKNSLSQTLTWDSKNDQGKYVASYEDLTVRVSLGIRPYFEKNLYWDPKRRQGRDAPVLKATKEGIFVYDGGTGLDFVKLFKANGDYIKTIYPFPGNTIKKVKGLHLKKMPDGVTLPLKSTYLRQTLLTSGNYYGYKGRKKDYLYPENVKISKHHYGMYWNASSFLAVEGGKVAIGMDYLARFLTNGTSGGMEVNGPPIAMTAPISGYIKLKHKLRTVVPRSGALSPDGKSLYLTGYHFCRYKAATVGILLPGSWHTFHGVFKMSLTSNKKPVLFVGSDVMDKKGSDAKSFNVPAHVAVDNKGNVYISDHMIHRVQIFSPEGKLLKSLSIVNPSQVIIEPFTQKVYAVSSRVYVGIHLRKKKLESKITVFSPFPALKKETVFDLPKHFNVFSHIRGNLGFPISVAIIKDKDETNIWISREWARYNGTHIGKNIPKSNISIFKIKNNKLVLKRDFAKEISTKNIRKDPPTFNRQRLYVNPKNRKLYLSEGETAEGKAFKFIREVDPETGKVDLLSLPFDAEDMCFDHNGYLYLRSFTYVVRYDITKSPWREIPWDYGNEVMKIHTGTSSGRKETSSVSALVMKGSIGGWHHGGMFVSLKGNIAVGCKSGTKGSNPMFTNFQGRSFAGRGGTPYVQVWDKHGKGLFKDFVPGLAANIYGIGLDLKDNVYIMSSGTRIFKGKRHYINESGTLMKFAPGKGKILSTGAKVPLPLDPKDYLKRDFDITNPAFGKAWVLGSDWMFGGVGWSGKNAGVGCSCWNAKFSMDYYNRSFAPEIDRYSIAMVDAAGNLITRIGTYGNADSRGPKSLAPLGGDEVGMMHGAYVAVDTDRRLFIADQANQKIISATLGYHKEERVSLKKYTKDKNIK